MDKTTKSKAAKSNNTGLEIPNADAHFFLACLQCMGDDKQIDLTKVGDMLGYSNVASVGNRFRSLRKRYGMNNLEAKSGSGILKSAGTNGDKDKEATGTTEAGDGVNEESDIDEPSPVKPKGRKVATRKGAKATSKPIPATGTLKSEVKGRKRGAKSAVAVKEEEEDDADTLIEDNTPDAGMESATA
ncbi:hypothetical protein CBS63078_8188 [Aspergillus niger]|uniref:Contig An01c0210, genomic contig n=5 Tax=Aspergillus TaxID=5052 RepID=A2Q8Y6_ASPNC|nr:uncharacterized protein An01g06010 [Aspergillus niger]XP_025456018.1 uncharacterized protein BO96DRAFT_492916 [Aspergillus niger CBS 101883]EHA26505.1 hypothetical protein ASPNIDRAFT_36070 [Aspergillus niger ATCC 1015]RDH17862.1 hypothetical protein M747DRAFT_355309 [Aspergillus niger ATCC 13496]RDK46132.1 hypothetical protein M752DRAFT_309653 [Aspergillus phoenicis ATCC 13157]KAI2824011.1 hypothetical protein CBS115989_830 [Aspergillus niger]KAI2861759.1 hypothetical protein CBS11232_745 |eukprot:XP_001389025.1 hypothetical protein ANI_1_2588014 [Aspergillus niger CBS 513.88]